MTDRWLDPLIDRQKPDGGIYVGDDEDAGGEVKLLGEDDASTAATALLILCQDPTRLVPGRRPQINWLALDLESPGVKKLDRVVKWGLQGKLGAILALVDRSIASRSAPPIEKDAATPTRQPPDAPARSSSDRTVPWTRASRLCYGVCRDLW